MTERFDPIQNITNILAHSSAGTVVARERLDLTGIGDHDDRDFMRRVVDTLLSIEPGNPDLLVNMNTDHPIYLVWAQGMRSPINDGHFKAIRELLHPIPGYEAVGNVQLYPGKGMQPMKLVVEVNPYGPKRALQEQLRYEQRRLESRGRRHSPPRRSPSRSLSPVRRSRSRRPPRLTSSDSSSSESPERGSLLDAINPFSRPRRSRR
jgi:hypothetical protein